MRCEISWFQAFGLALTLAFVQFAGSQVRAQDDGTYSSYESIVRDLSSTHHNIRNSETEDSIDIIRFHTGVGLITSRLSMDLPRGLSSSKTLRGYEAWGGIDLFSVNWVAEVAVRTFDPERLGSNEISMKEFDLLVIYNAQLSQPLGFSVGGGMSARYLDITGAPTNFPRSNTTPASVLTLGLSANFTKIFSLTGQISYRSPLVQDTIDDGSVDGSIRLAGHF